MSDAEGLFLLFWIAVMFGYMEGEYYKFHGKRDGR